MLYEVTEAEERYPITYRPQTPSPISTVTQRASIALSQSAGATASQVMSVSTYMCQPPHRGNGGESASQGSLMEQISCVVNSFTANISELNSMMLSNSPPGDAVGLSTSASAHAHSVEPCCPPPYRLSREISMPTTMTTYAEIQPLPPVEINVGRSAPPCPLSSSSRLKTSPTTSGKDLKGGVSSALQSPPNQQELEELLALTPPSPFRDSVGSGSGSPSSPASDTETSVLPPIPKYECLMLRHYSQSSSSLWGQQMEEWSAEWRYSYRWRWTPLECVFTCSHLRTNAKQGVAAPAEEYLLHRICSRITTVSNRSSSWRSVGLF